jgi:hypothetical protein
VILSNHIRLIGRLLLTAGLAVVGSVALAGSAQASFDPGRIIDDSVFVNKNSMSAQDIQNFLNSKVTACDTWHTPGSGSQGEQPPWTCLKDYGEGGRSAAQIIYDAAQNYNLNPQVLIVTLQKENGLITDSWPYRWQYRTAMGMGCPDGAACDAQYFGFTNQVNQGARHLRGFYDQNAGWYIPYRPGVNFIKWNPNSACGGSNVNIVNRATASLYSYTPYQPNAAALNNLYGTGDSCSAYGNRNFWRDFTSWFGDTYGRPYAWEGVSQGSNRDLSALPAGETARWTLSARNTGTTTWTNSGVGAIRLGTSSPNDRDSSFYSTRWLNPARTTNLIESSVPPGSVGTFSFEVQAPATPGYYLERFNLVADGITWLNDPGLVYGANVVAADLKGAVTADNTPTTMAAGSTAQVTISVRNDGNLAWYQDGRFPIKLGTTNPRDRPSPFMAGDWLGPQRIKLIDQDAVGVGQTASFTFTIKAPPNNGTYAESFGVVADGLGWSSIDIPHSITVTGGQENPPQPVYRLYNPNSNSHFFTTSTVERDNVQRLGFGYEGVAYYASGTVTAAPVYRLYNPKSYSHFFTTNPVERDNAQRIGFGYEGIAYYAAAGVTSVPVYRLYNPKSYSHFFTTSPVERDNAQRLGFGYEGIAFYAIPQ